MSASLISELAVTSDNSQWKEKKMTVGVVWFSVGICL